MRSDSINGRWLNQIGRSKETTFQNSLPSPRETENLCTNCLHLSYLYQFTDYSEEHKQLNYIQAFHLPVCQVNVISKLGYGLGPLRRTNHIAGVRRQLPGVPYQLKVGSEWSEQIPYDNPEDFLTFRWFKQNVMCKEQPWICE